MNVQAMYDRLQCDMISIYGLCPQLIVSRVPKYEALWKDMLLCIEFAGVSPVTLEPQHVSCQPDADYLVSDRMCRARLLIDGSSTTLDYPTEMADLVEAFWSTRSSRYLRCLRQVCLFTYKSKSHENTTEQVESSVSGFVSRNATCHGLSKPSYERQARSDSSTGQTLKIARLLIGIIADPVDWFNIKPAHGTGAVSDSKKGREKWNAIDGRASRITDKFYPMAEFFSPTPAMFNPTAATYATTVAKMAIVPKDKRGPRIICTQPSGLMWIQQGQRRAFEKAIETSSILRTHRDLVSDGILMSIKFDKQEQNGSLALESSRTREFATIDLKDASDLVSWGLIRFLFNKRNCQFLAASRPTHVKIRSELVKLHMYAPMGSAMCFPVESVVFWALAAAACLVSRGVYYEDITRFRNASKWLSRNVSEVFVFGDDILVRREACKDVCHAFESVGFKPNYSKTFSHGLYRESCGVDAYNGDRLDICRLQSASITSMSDAYASIELCNRARGMGMVHLSEWLECQVESYLGFGLPFGLSDGAFWLRGWPANSLGQKLCLEHNMHHRRRIRYNYHLQHWEGMTVVCRPRTLSAPEDGRCRLFRGLTTTVDEHTVDWLSPDNQQYHLGWARAF